MAVAKSPSHQQTPSKSASTTVVPFSEWGVNKQPTCRCDLPEARRQCRLHARRLPARPPPALHKRNRCREVFCVSPRLSVDTRSGVGGREPQRLPSR